MLTIFSISTTYGWLLVINAVRKFKGLPPTFLELYSYEKKLIRSHGKWIYTGQKWGSNYFDIYKCKDCGAKICRNNFAFLDFYENDEKYKTKTCGEICMEDLFE